MITVGYIYLIMARLAAVAKMMAVKKCGNIASGAKNSLKINLLRSTGSLAVAIIVCTFSGFEKMNSYGVIFTVISGISQGLMLWSWILAAENAPIITVEVFCMVGGVVIPLIISPLVLSAESVTLVQWIGSLLLFCAMYCLTKRGNGGKITPKSILYMCIAGLSNTGVVISQKFYSELGDGTVADFQLGTFLFTIAVLAVILFIMQLVKKTDNTEKSPKITARVFVFISIAFVMTYLAQFLSTAAAGRIHASVLYPLTYVISMPLVFLLDVTVFKEKLTARGILGILFVTASGILINM